MKKHLTEEARVEAINAVIENMLGGRKPRADPQAVLRPLLHYYRETSPGPVCYISTEGPTRHESAVEFESAKKPLDELQQAIIALREAIDNLPEDQRQRIDHAAWHFQADENLSLAKIAAMEGLLESQSRFLEEMMFATQPEERRLSDEKAKWWSRRGPKNYRAYAIAKSLADLYVKQLLKKPTYGTNYKANVPSTKFCKALDRIYKILEIEGGFIGPAKAAVKSITDEDILNAKRAAYFLGFLHLTRAFPGR